MNELEIENLLRGGVEPGPETWADLGSGAGGVTSALAKLLGPGAKVYSVDSDPDKQKKQKELLQSRGQLESVVLIQQDFTEPLNLPLLDGVLMSNSLHFVRDQKSLLLKVRSYLKPNGKFILVEYDTDMGNQYVPHPLSFKTFIKIAQNSGFAEPKQFATSQSRYWDTIYSAITYLL